MSLLDWYRSNPQVDSSSSTGDAGGASLTGGIPFAETTERRHPNQKIIPNNGVQVSNTDIVTTTQTTQVLKSTPEVFKSLPKGIVPGRAPRTRFFDPLSLMYATGYKDRRYSVSYDSLRRTSYQLGLVGAIINTRVNQVAAFAQPYRATRQVGFKIGFKDDLYEPNEEERQALVRLEQMIQSCGFGENPYSVFPRHDFEGFLRMVVRDSLTYDQMCFEVVPDTEGRPYEFRAVDAATIRLAATYEGRSETGNRNFHSDLFTDRWKKEYGEGFTVASEGVYTVQVLHGRIENIFTYHDMAFCVRNPRTDTWVNGYGFSELEMALNTILGMLYGEEYNRRFFTQGAAPKGILNIKGDTISPEEMESFRRQWYQQISGVENAWKTPVIQADGMEYQNLQQSNKEMEFQRWLEYLLKILTSVYLIDPSEINFDIGGSGHQNPMFESKHEWKIKHSRDKGLRPLLRFLARQMQKYVIDPLDSRLSFDFVGLDEVSESDRVELATKKLSNYMTVNEVRMEEGLEPIAGGNIVLNPTFMQAFQADPKANPSALDDMAPWDTSDSEYVPPTYGTANAVPLIYQMEKEGGQEEGGGEEMGDMMGGMMGM